jgi:hypothetical protein
LPFEVPLWQIVNSYRNRHDAQYASRDQAAWNIPAHLEFSLSFLF